MYHCAVCDESFKTSGGLTNHLRSQRHLNGGKFRCELCCRNFASKQKLERHLNSPCHKRREGAVEFQCRKCTEIFHSPDDLRRHARQCRKGIYFPSIMFFTQELLWISTNNEHILLFTPEVFSSFHFYKKAKSQELNFNQSSSYDFQFLHHLLSLLLVQPHQQERRGSSGVSSVAGL